MLLYFAVVTNHSSGCNTTLRVSHVPY